MDYPTAAYCYFVLVLDWRRHGVALPRAALEDLRQRTVQPLLRQRIEVVLRTAS